MCIQASRKQASLIAARMVLRYKHRYAYERRAGRLNVAEKNVNIDEKVGPKDRPVHKTWRKARLHVLVTS